MAKYIPLDAVVAEIENRIKAIPRGETDKRLKAVYGNEAFVLNDLLSVINTLEVKEVDFWHKQSEEDIDDSIIGWSMHSFICLMKDGTTQEFTGIQDESYEGGISKHLDCVDDNYEWEYDDIVYWIEIPMIKAQKGE